MDSPLQPFWFPGGEAHIKIDNTKQVFQYQLADLRGAKPKDLIMLAMWEDAVRQRGERAVLLLPYLPGARADRGIPFGAKVYAEFINNLVLDQVITLDPHSPVMPSLLSGNNSEVNVGGSGTLLTVFPFQHIIKTEVQNGSRDSGPHPYDGVIAPDKGAHERAGAAAKLMGVPVFQAGKTRDFETGKLTGFQMEDKLPKKGKFLIVDDICDGGGTFNGLADAINIGPDRLDLWVTHGIFSKGLEDLKTRFGTIHTTDSWNGDLVSNKKDHLVVHPTLPYLTSAIDF